MNLYDEKIERAVLGALMIDSSACFDVFGKVKHEKVFYNKKHQYVFKAIEELFQSNDAIDLLTVSQKLKKHKKLDLIGDYQFLLELSQSVSSSSHTEHHVLILLQLYMQRAMRNMGQQIISEAEDESKDIFEVMERAIANMMHLSGDIASGQFYNSIQVAKEVHDKVMLLSGDNPQEFSGVPVGFEKLDGQTGGFQPGDLIVLAARPGMGKTALAISWALNAAYEDYPVGVFSLEMSRLQLGNRTTSILSGLPLHYISKYGVRENDMKYFHDGIKKFEDLPLFFDDTAGLSVMDLRIKAQRLVREHKVKMIMVDYLQLMEVGSARVFGNNQNDKVAYISRQLKLIAKELEIPVIILSQLSRGVEQRGGFKRPMLSDLRDSGAIEQDADMVMFIYRPEYYGYKTDEVWMDKNGNCWLDPMLYNTELDIAKFRNGAPATLGMYWKADQTKYVQYAPGTAIVKNDNPFEDA